MDNISKNIKTLRVARGLSQKALANLCGWETNSRIANYEAEGTTKREPSLRDIKIIAKALKVSPAILAFDEYPTASDFPAPGIKGLPILNKNIAAEWPSNKDLAIKSHDIDFLSKQISLGMNSFVYELEDDSMFNFMTHEGFRKGKKVIIDPDKEHSIKNCVLVKKKNFLMVRVLDEDEEGLILSPFDNHGQFPKIPLTKDIKICGVVVAYIDVLI